MSQETTATITDALLDRYGADALAFAQRQTEAAIDDHMRQAWVAVMAHLSLRNPEPPRRCPGVT